MTQPSLHHVAYACQDLEQTRHFYEDLVGLPLVLLIIFGNIPGFRKPVSRATPGVSVLDAYVPVLLSFVLAMIALNVLPPVLAGYREKGVLRRLSATPVGDKRLLSFALDQKTTIDTSASDGSSLVRARLAKGLLTVEELNRHRTVYHVKASEPRRLIVERRVAIRRVANCKATSPR